MNYSGLDELVKPNLPPRPEHHRRSSSSRIHVPISPPEQQLNQLPPLPPPMPVPQPVQRYDDPYLYPPCPRPPCGYDITYPIEDRSRIIMSGSNPIRGGMYTAVRPNICSQYGSSSINLSPSEYYTGSQWCTVGVLINDHSDHMNNIFSLEAQFNGTNWVFRARDPIAHIFINLNTMGNGSYGAYRDNDTVMIPGKHGIWKVQIQTNQNPYILYIP